MNSRIKLEIETICNNSPAVECCGFVILRVDGLHLMPCHNISPSPQEEFEISSSDQIKAQTMGRVLYVWHSHPIAKPFNSDDIDSAEESTLPQRLYSIPDNRWYEYTPSTYKIAPLEGRVWAWGESDCYSLIRDYYWSNFGVMIGDYDRDENSAKLGDTLLANFEREGFVKYPSLNQLHKHDVMVFRTNGSPQHMAVFMGNTRVLHHPRDGLSKVDLYSTAWHRRLHFVAHYQGTHPR